MFQHGPDPPFTSREDKMVKSHGLGGGPKQAALRELSTLYTALFEDAKYAFPDERDWFELDRARLSRCVAKAGVRVYLVDLPALGKHLDRCLSEGSYRCTGLYLGGKCPGHIQLPEFLRELYLRVFDANGSLKEEIDVEALFFLRQILYGAKKTCLPCSDEAIDEEVTSFVQVDAALPAPDSFWTEEHPHDDVICSRFRGLPQAPTTRRKCKDCPMRKGQTPPAS